MADRRLLAVFAHPDHGNKSISEGHREYDYLVYVTECSTIRRR
jgi:hypothetical protein